MRQNPVRVLLVDDSPLALNLLQRLLATSPDIEVVGTATNGRDALEAIPQLQPTIICTDYVMPGMNGLEFTRHVMARYPRPILVVSSTVRTADTDRAFELLEAGAVDVFPKPRAGAETEAEVAAQFVKKVKIVSGVWVRGRPAREPTAVAPGQPAALSSSALATRPPQVVAIGASTGGPQALQAILSRLPARFPVPILCVQHISGGFLPGLVSWLGTHYHGRVQIARPDELPLPGRVYFPQEETHLVIDRMGRLHASAEPPRGGHRPAVDVTFETVADFYGDAAIGVLLTGMGHDGGAGMQRLAQAGALTIAQDKATSVVYGMPKDAVDRGAARMVLPLDEIARALIEAVYPRQHPSGEKS